MTPDDFIEKYFPVLNDQPDNIPFFSKNDVRMALKDFLTVNEPVKTLRDEFAMNAMNGSIDIYEQEKKHYYSTSQPDLKVLVDHSYKVADAMIERRKQK